MLTYLIYALLVFFVIILGSIFAIAPTTQGAASGLAYGLHYVFTTMPMLCGILIILFTYLFLTLKQRHYIMLSYLCMFTIGAVNIFFTSKGYLIGYYEAGALLVQIWMIYLLNSRLSVIIAIITTSIAFHNGVNSMAMLPFAANIFYFMVGQILLMILIFAIMSCLYTLFSDAEESLSWK